MYFLKWSIAAMLFMSAAACNTMEGLGEDVQAGGEKLEQAAEKSKRK